MDKSCKYPNCTNVWQSRRKEYCRAHGMQLWRAKGDQSALKPLKIKRPPRVSEDGTEARCSTCNQWKPESDFPWDSTRQTVQRVCYDCKAKKQRNWHQENPEYMRIMHLKKKGLTVEQYEEMLAVQNGVCAICREPERSGRRLAVDHDHLTGVNRSLLCGGCNRAIGYLDENPQRLRAAIQYLEKWSSNGTT